MMILNVEQKLHGAFQRNITVTETFFTRSNFRFSAEEKPAFLRRRRFTAATGNVTFPLRRHCACTTRSDLALCRN